MGGSFLRLLPGLVLVLAALGTGASMYSDAEIRLEKLLVSAVALIIGTLLLMRKEEREEQTVSEQLLEKAASPSNSGRLIEPYVIGMQERDRPLILIASANDEIGKQLKEMGAEFTFGLVTASDSLDTLGILRRRAPDAVVWDVDNMDEPASSIMDLLIQGGQALPFILVSAGNETPTVPGEHQAMVLATTHSDSDCAQNLVSILSGLKGGVFSVCPACGRPVPEHDEELCPDCLTSYHKSCKQDDCLVCNLGSEKQSE